jgi:stage II sporulation protein AA (anti-sigma F factor antagonist)
MLADGHLVTVRGDVDLETAPQLAETLAQFASGTIRVDIAAVTYLDSSGLNTLIAAHRYITRAGRRMIICGPLNPIVKQVFEITGLDDVFEIHEQAPQQAGQRAS